MSKPFRDTDIRLQEIAIELSNMRAKKIMLEAEQKRLLATQQPTNKEEGDDE